MPQTRIDSIQQRLAPLKSALIEHPIYGEIDCVQKLHLFMEHHVFAVWDFMSLLKALQRTFCGDDTPWLPPDNLIAARLVNEIVLGEESDEDGSGGYASHFDLYHRAMDRTGASTRTIDRFLAELREGASVELALLKCDASECVRAFVLQTFEVVENGDLCAIASTFTFGREDLLPDVFQRIVDELNDTTSGGLDDFRFYLGRHIELDGDHHGPMATRLISFLCGDDEVKWKIAEDAAVCALQARKLFWDGMYEAMRSTEQFS
jgi:hypothetical protein